MKITINGSKFNFSNMKLRFSVIIIVLRIIHLSAPNPVIVEQPKSSINIGTCTWILDRKCPDDEVKFWLYTRANIEDRELIHVDETWEKSNISESNYNPQHAVKIIIHGYNSDMFLTPLIDMKDEYLQRGFYNLFYVDWAVLAPAPCYPAAVHNTKHIGECIAQLVDRIRDTGNTDIHLVGFSLGAQVTNYVANKLKPDYILPRISGLDPALPLFIFADNENKLDPSDAEFVDVIHTNALVQGKIERCGTVDFYMNGGIYQPGCSGRNIFACSHHRAPDYFSESIRSSLGFWGWECQSYIYYLLGMCPVTNMLQTVAGEDCKTTTKGMYLIKTNSASPFALGRLSDFMVPIEDSRMLYTNFASNTDPFQREIDHWGKLEGSFNNIEMYPTPFSQDPNGDDWPYFNHIGSNRRTQQFISRLKHQHESEVDQLKNLSKRPLIIRKNSSIRTATDTTISISNNTRQNLFEDYKKNSSLGIKSSEIFGTPTIAN